MIDSAVAAEPTPQKDESQRQAEEKVGEARAAYERGDYQQSLVVLREAQSLYDSPKLQFNFGLVYKALGRDVEALDAFTKFLRDVPGASADRRSEAERQVSELRSRVAWLDIASDAEGAEVFVDGRSYGKTPLSTSVVVAPGPHQVVVQKDGQPVPYTDRVEARAGTEIRIQARVVLPPSVPMTPSVQPAVLAAPAEPPPAPARPLYKRWWLWTGAAALVGGTVAAIAAIHTRDSGTVCSDCNVGTFKVPAN